MNVTLLIKTYLQHYKYMNQSIHPSLLECHFSFLVHATAILYAESEIKSY